MNLVGLLKKHKLMIFLLVGNLLNLIFQLIVEFELKDHYRRGGLGDVKVKRFLYDVIEDILEPIRSKRKYYEDNINLVYDMLKEGSKKANMKAEETLKRVKKAMLIDYFD